RLNEVGRYFQVDARCVQQFLGQVDVLGVFLDGPFGDQLGQDKGFQPVQDSRHADGAADVTVHQHAVIGKGYRGFLLEGQHQEGMGDVLELDRQVNVPRSTVTQVTEPAVAGVLHN